MNQRLQTERCMQRATGIYTLMPSSSWTRVIDHDYATAPNFFIHRSPNSLHRFGDACMGSAPFGGCNHIPIPHSTIAYLHVSAQPPPRDGLSVSSDPRAGPPWHRIISRDYSVRPIINRLPIWPLDITQALTTNNV